MLYSQYCYNPSKFSPQGEHTQDMEKIHIWPEKISEQNGFVTAGFTLEDERHERKNLWYHLPAEFTSNITERAEPYVVAALFKAMSTPANIIVHGEVSPSLISNLEEFQSVWSAWMPDRYQVIEIVPEVENEPTNLDKLQAVMAFSAGVDSCFTAWRYRKPKGKWLPYPLSAGLLVHGFDFPPQFDDTFDRATNKSSVMVKSLGMTLIPLTTNLRTITRPMTDAHGAFLISCLILLQEKFAAGLIASSYDYATMQWRWGSNPLTDPMLSSSTYPILHDGARYSRLEKIDSFKDWPEALQNLRVCTGREASERDKNCCRCEKCIRTILEMRALGLGLPACFEKDVSLQQIRKMNISEEVIKAKFYDEILSKADRQKTNGPWVKALRSALIRNRVTIRAKRSPLISNLYRMFKR